MKMSKGIAILGTGSWATALALVLSDNGHRVRMLGIDSDEISDINQNHRNSKYFDEIDLPETIYATSNAVEVLEGADTLVIAVPTRVVGGLLLSLRHLIPPDMLVVNASKGFDPNTNGRMTQTIRLALGPGHRVAPSSIIGPSHAEEVVRRQLTLACAVSMDEAVAKRVQELFAAPYLRLYVNTDEIGAEYGAAVKNVIAIAGGILVGIGYGDNAKAALVTRGMAEMLRYGLAKGTDPNTYFGLTGLGDLVVTCFSANSRNYEAGLAIGRQNGVEKFFAENTKTVEGIYSCKVVHDDLVNYDFEMPIIQSLYEVLYEGKLPSDAIRELMERPLGVE